LSNKFLSRDKLSTQRDRNTSTSHRLKLLLIRFQRHCKFKMKRELKMKRTRSMKIVKSRKMK
jgi:hypothetical protein